MNSKLKIHAWGILRYGILLACLLGLWWYFRTYELFVMITMAIALLVCSVFVLWWKRDAFRIRILLPTAGIGKEHAVPLTICVDSACRIAGFSAEMTYQVKNMFTEYGSTAKERIWIAPGTKAVLDRELLSHHMGRVEVTVTEFAVSDWLGICTIEDKHIKNACVIVGPEGTRTSEEELVNSIEDFPDENETKKRGTDINPDYEIREYVPGDDLKNIHWKLTAKTGRPMVRERLATGREKINVLLALTKDAAENDALMSSLHGLGRLLLDKGYPIRLCYLGHGDLLQARYLAEEGELANVMDEILSTSGLKDPALARTIMETEYPGEAYVLVKNGTFKGAYVR